MKTAGLLAALKEQKALHVAASTAIDGVIQAIATAMELPTSEPEAADVAHVTNPLFAEQPK